MTNIISIFKKELNSFFDSSLAYIAIFLFLIITGVGFFNFSFFLQKQADVRDLFFFCSAVYIITIPAITMRLISEELKNGTLELLTTYPVTDFQIVFGKFLASLTLLTITIALTFVYTFSVSTLGNLDEGIVMGGYIGLILMGAVLIALGVYISSATDSQVVALIVSVAVIFFWIFLDNILIFIGGNVRIFEFIAIDTHFTNIQRGVVDSRDIIYYFSFITLFLFLATRSLAGRKWA
ncbi:MAG: ABC transporter [Calditrichaeota bacterium]|nr:MAG: ABC transporter [Calditrichota bacterium]